MHSLPTLLVAPADVRQVLALQPALQLWRLANASQHLTVLAPRKVTALFQAMPEVSEVIELSPTQSMGAFYGSIRRLKSRQFFQAYLFSSRLHARLLLTMLHIKHRQSDGLIQNRIQQSKQSIFNKPISSQDYAAALLGLSSTSEVPIHLPKPSLRPNLQLQREVLSGWGIPTVLHGVAGQVPRIKTDRPLFFVNEASDILVQELLSIFRTRWPEAILVAHNKQKIRLFESNSEPQHVAKPFTAALADQAELLAFIAMATVVIADHGVMMHLADAFSTPIVSLISAHESAAEVATHIWPSSQGRYIQAYSSAQDILQSMEKVLRFDRQPHRMSRTL